MSWLKKDTRLRNHPKLIAAAGALGIKPVHLQGHLDSLWLGALERYEDGDLSGIDDEAIAILAEWNTKTAGRFVQVLTEKKWLDNRLIHDWLDYVGDFLKRRYRKSPDKLLAIYRKYGRESEILKEDSSGTRTGHVPDESGTTPEEEKEKETTHTLAREIPEHLLSVAQTIISLTPDVPLQTLRMDYPDDWIEKALKKCGLTSRKGVEAVVYARGILQSWQKKGGPDDDGKPFESHGASSRSRERKPGTKPGKYAAIDAANFGT